MTRRLGPRGRTTAGHSIPRPAAIIPMESRTRRRRPTLAADLHGPKSGVHFNPHRLLPRRARGRSARAQMARGRLQVAVVRLLTGPRLRPQHRACRTTRAHLRAGTRRAAKDAKGKAMSTGRLLRVLNIAFGSLAQAWSTAVSGVTVVLAAAVAPDGSSAHPVCVDRSWSVARGVDLGLAAGKHDKCARRRDSRVPPRARSGCRERPCGQPARRDTMSKCARASRRRPARKACAPVQELDERRAASASR